MKVIKAFRDVTTGIKYRVGDDYKGDRKDLGDYLAKPKRKVKKNG